MSTATDETEAQRIHDAIYQPPAPPRPVRGVRRRVARTPRRALTVESAQQLMNDAASYDAEMSRHARRPMRAGGANG